MITVEQGEGGLYLARWNGTDAQPELFFVPEDELAGVIADLIAQATTAPEADRWGTYAALCGNPVL